VILPTPKSFALSVADATPCDRAPYEPSTIPNPPRTINPFPTKTRPVFPPRNQSNAQVLNAQNPKNANFFNPFRHKCLRQFPSQKSPKNSTQKRMPALRRILHSHSERSAVPITIGKESLLNHKSQTCPQRKRGIQNLKSGCHFDRRPAQRAEVE
jgi:hypothetical protein